MKVLTQAVDQAVDWTSGPKEQAGTLPEIFRLGPCLIHRRTGRVESLDREHYLRAKELELVAHLYEHATVIFSREELLQQVWKYHPDLLTRTVDQTVATLRKKLEADPRQPRFLQTVYGVGYRLVL